MTLDWFSFALGAAFMGFGWLCAAVAKAPPKEKPTGTLRRLPVGDSRTVTRVGAAETDR